MTSVKTTRVGEIVKIPNPPSKFGWVRFYQANKTELILKGRLVKAVSRGCSLKSLWLTAKTPTFMYGDSKAGFILDQGVDLLHNPINLFRLNQKACKCTDSLLTYTFISNSIRYVLDVTYTCCKE